MTPEQIQKVIETAIKENTTFPFWLYLIAILCAAIGGYLGSYLNNKAKNLATKEDVKDITRLVEGVKNKFNNDLEHVKAELEIISTTRLNLLKEERNTIVDFNLSYYKWYHSNIQLSEACKSYSNDRAQKCFEKIEISFIDMLINEAKFELIVEDDNLISQKNNLKTVTLEALFNKPQSFLLEIQKYNLKYDYLYEKLRTTKDDKEEDIFVEKITEIINKKIKLHDSYLSETLNIHDSVHQAQKTFRDSSKLYLYKSANIIKKS
ncbi:hypothetical protein [Desulfosediminicola sp.]|uniref:hypothetical protein n=1 Tax=Desulfosediminicola sp. TaxID=2886825 RepID=UPI003AF2872A